MGFFITGLVLGMFITYGVLKPEDTKLLTTKIVEQIKKLIGRK